VSDPRLAGLLLIAAAISSFIAATMPSLSRERVWMLPLPEYLRVIATHERQWRAHAWLFAIGTVLMALGLTFVARSVVSGYALAALFLYALVAPLWLAHLAYRMDMTSKAAHDDDARATFELVGYWTGSLYTIYMVGGYFSIALLGAALAGGPLIPAWCAQILMALGAVSGFSHWGGWPQVAGMRSPFDLPVLVQLFPLFAAIPLAAGA
jgi:hypothetical protein